MKKQNTTYHLIDYYQLPFMMLERDISNSVDFETPHPIRERFWKLVPPGTYTAISARPFLESYLTSLEAELAKCIKGKSIAYFSHLSHPENRRAKSVVYQCIRV